MMKYEILFFVNQERVAGDQRTYRVQADTMLEAFFMWSCDWPTGCAYYAKEGWDSISAKVVYHDPNAEKRLPAGADYRTPKERREAAKKLRNLA